MQIDIGFGDVVTPSAEERNSRVGSRNSSAVYSAYCTATGRSSSGLKNRLARAAKMIGVKPITAA